VTVRTVLGEASYRHVLDQTRSEAGHRYQSGGEPRVDGTLACRDLPSGRTRVDVAPERSVLDLRRDREDGVALRAPGRTVLCGQLGVRAVLGPASIGASVKRAAARSLNEAAGQQGPEGLESYRAFPVIGVATRL
jgi:hypothetical protein